MTVAFLTSLELRPLLTPASVPGKEHGRRAPDEVRNTIFDVLICDADRIPQRELDSFSSTVCWNGSRHPRPIVSPCAKSVVVRDFGLALLP